MNLYTLSRRWDNSLLKAKTWLGNCLLFFSGGTTSSIGYIWHSNLPWPRSNRLLLAMTLYIGWFSMKIYVNIILCRLFCRILLWWVWADFDDRVYGIVGHTVYESAPSISIAYQIPQYCLLGASEVFMLVTGECWCVGQSLCVSFTCWHHEKVSPVNHLTRKRGCFTAPLKPDCNLSKFLIVYLPVWN